MNLTNIYYLHEIGEKRNQEDYIWPVEGKATPQGKVFIVCDGVGGSENGEVAARIIAESMGAALSNDKGHKISLEYINELLDRAQKELVLYARTNQLNNDMATTFSLLVLLDNKAYIVWCGDSRVYHIRDGEVLFKTEDHSLVSTLVKSGELTEEEAMQHPRKNVILKAIKADGSPIGAEGHWIESVQDQDYFMLCTDGLLENISNEDLKYLLNNKDHQDKDLAAIINEKCKGKTRDNYSMYLLRIESALQSSSARKKNKVPLFFLFLVVVIIAIAFVMKMNNGQTSLQLPVDSSNNQTQNKSSIPAITGGQNLDTLQEFEIVSADTNTEIVPELKVSTSKLNRGDSATNSKKNIPANIPDSLNYKKEQQKENKRPDSNKIIQSN